MQFLALLRRLNASQQSIQKVVTFAVKYFPPCGEDLWDCVVEECQKGSINSRINIFYFLDSLCEACLKPKDGVTNNQYVDYLVRDLAKVVQLVVPSGREGLPNLTSTKQILESWRNKRVVDPQIVDELILGLAERQESAVLTDPEPPEPKAQQKSVSKHSKSSASLPRHEVIKRIEEDRERHKRLRQRRWVQPVSHSMNPTPLPLSFLPLTDKAEYDYERSIDVEFDNDWETLSDWNEDDDEACKEENELCFPNGLGTSSMDLSP